MVMSRNTAIGSIVVGTIELTFSLITVICGAVAVGKLSGQAAATAGLWSLYYAVPGILTITAGVSKNMILMAFALVFNIIAVILSLAAAGVSLGFAIILSGLTLDNCSSLGDSCKCITNDVYDTDSETYDMNCSDIDTLYAICVAMAAVYAILAISSFAASIYGCLGTCCSPSDPVVIVAGGMPAQGGNTVVVQSSQSTMHGYPAMAEPAAPPNYDQRHDDNSTLVKNMVV